MQENVLYKNPVLKKIFTEAEFLYDAPLTISQISFEKKTQVENHVLMLGDAAGMITPLCGNGMSMAMHSAKLAFNEIDNYLATKNFKSRNGKKLCCKWKKEFALRLATGRFVQRFMGNEISTRCVFKIHECISVFIKSYNSFNTWQNVLMFYCVYTLTKFYSLYCLTGSNTFCIIPSVISNVSGCKDDHSFPEKLASKYLSVTLVIFSLSVEPLVAISAGLSWLP